MKKTALLLFFWLIIINLGFAQETKLPTNRKGDVEFKESVKVDGATSAQLFERAHKFFSETYANPKDVIDVDDKDAGKITGYGTLNGGGNYLISYSIEINVADGSYDYTFTPFSYVLQINAANASTKQPFTADKPSDMDSKKWAVFTANTFTGITLLSSQLKTTMAK